MAVGKNFIDEIISAYDALATAWRDEAVRRYGMNPEDPLPNVYNEVAAEQEKLGTTLHERFDLVTVEEYAELNNLTPQTVRRWCSMGQLTHYDTDKGMVIVRHARRNPEIRGDS